MITFLLVRSKTLKPNCFSISANAVLKADCDTEHISAARLKWRVLLTAKAYWICFSEMIGKVEFLYSNILNIRIEIINYTDRLATYKVIGFEANISGKICPKI